jgi:hypothetical protein
MSKDSDLDEWASSVVDMTDARFVVYGLIDPTTKLVRYVGKSSSGMTRVKAHRCVYPSDRTYRANWLRSLKADGLQHEECILDVVSEDSLPQRRSGGLHTAGHADGH